MGAAARMIQGTVLALAVCLVTGGCTSVGGQRTFIDRAETAGGLCPLSIANFKPVAPLPPPAGFSSTYQKYLLDRQLLARLPADQVLQAKASSNTSPANDGRAESR